MIPFIDLKAQRRRLGDSIDTAIGGVLDHAGFIMGPEVKVLESQLAKFSGTRHAVACSSGTDALLLGLMALGVGRGDAVLVPSFTFVATAEVVALLGATPIFLDVDAESFNLAPSQVQAGAESAKQAGLRPVGVIVVDLFGRPADYQPIEAAADTMDLWVLCDAAQSYGAVAGDGRKVGTVGRMTTTSFFPAKPLGCYGDGGAILTDDDDLAQVMRSLLVHGKGTDKYDNVRIGMNGRIDTIQAAILIEKLSIFPDEIEARNAVARRYCDAFADLAGVTPPLLGDNAVVSTWAQFTLRLECIDRSAFQAALKQDGVPTAVYYPKPLHQQTAYRDFPMAGNGLPVSEQLSQTVVSLPMHPYLEAGDQSRIIDAVTRAAA